MFSTILLINKDTKTLVAFGTAKRHASVDTNGPFGSEFQAHVEVWSWVPLYIDIGDSWGQFRGGIIGDVETWRQIRTYIQNAMRVDQPESAHAPDDNITPAALERYRAEAAANLAAEAAANLAAAALAPVQHEIGRADHDEQDDHDDENWTPAALERFRAYLAERYWKPLPIDIEID